MILSSADILRILGGSEIIRLSAKLSIADSKPSLSGAEGLFIYVNRFPSVDEFEATWTIWIESDGSELDDLVLAEITKLLPAVKVASGLLTTITTTDFLSVNTQRAPEAPKTKTAQVDLTQYEERFQSLVEDVQDQMLLVSSGRPGKDGVDGIDGRDGADGKDIDATETSLFELKDVDRGIPLQKGQVLMWSGAEWTNLYVPQVMPLTGSGGGAGDGEGVIISDTAPDTRDDGSELQEGDQWWQSSTGVMYVWYVDTDSGQWVQSSGGDGSSSSTLAGLLDTDTSGVEDGDILVYRTATGNWTAETQSLVGSIDDLSDVDTSTTAPDVNQALIWDGSEWVPGDVAQDAPVDSVNGQTGAVVLTAADVGAATSAQGSLADSAVQPGDNISDLANDAGYITVAEVPSVPVTSVAGKTGDVTLIKADITDFNDADYATAAQGATADTALQPGDNISELSNDSGYITDAGVTQIVAGDNITIDPVGGTGVVTVNGSATGVEEAPQDGNYYVRASGTWVKLIDALSALGVAFNEPVDAGNFTTGLGTAITNRLYDGGNFTNGNTAATDSEVIDGGLTTP